MARAAITFKTSGKYPKTTAYLAKLQRMKMLEILNRYGALGVAALAAATPVDSGETASSWYYTVGAQNGQYWIDFHNRNMAGSIPVVILIHYGHATRNGGYVQGRPFIDKVCQPIFDQILKDVQKEVSKL